MGADADLQDEMSCKELVELVTDYLEKDLPAPERARFEVHITNCTGCTEYLEQMRVTLRIAGKLEEETLASPAREELMDAFRNWKTRDL